MNRIQDQRSFAVPFFCVTALYYGGYCLFGGFMVLYLSENGYSAFFCGIVTSLTCLINLLVQPLAGYLTDTIITVKRYLIVASAAIAALSAFASQSVKSPALCVLTISMLAVFEMPYTFLLDAWISIAHEQDPRLVYGQIRAGGSIGFGLVAILFGWYSSCHGFDSFFPIQSAVFVLLTVGLMSLPETPLRNRKISAVYEKDANKLTLPQSLCLVWKNRRYRTLTILFFFYWLSHRPVGSYLSLIVQSRGGDAGIFGMVSGLGAIVEAGVLFAIAATAKKLSLKKMLLAMLLITLVRPTVLLMTDHVAALFVVQFIQSASFAFYYSASVQGYYELSDPKIRAFSMTFGLAVTSVLGTMAANLIGGWLCDKIGTNAVIWMSMLFTTANLIYFLCSQKNFNQKETEASI